MDLKYLYYVILLMNNEDFVVKRNGQKRTCII